MLSQAALMARSSRPVTAQRDRLYLRCFLTGIGQGADSNRNGRCFFGVTVSRLDGKTNSQNGSSVSPANASSSFFHSPLCNFSSVP